MGPFTCDFDEYGWKYQLGKEMGASFCDYEEYLWKYQLTK